MAYDSNTLLTEVYIVLLFIASGALVLVLYNCISMIAWGLDRRRRQQGLVETGRQETEVKVDDYVVGHIPTHKHMKVAGSEEDEHVCAVCLSEFEEGEELRTLPKCMHSFHVPCIDMWLCSHRSCPICRVDATIVAPPSVDIMCVVDP
ncbi:putative transcription factor C2H2 family [Helianthus annuus]|uniref:Putative zinc finger, RING/FYVE/PHD-type n=1 Tax=Helianthus annuus TaxID=4232 RepID=A0A251U4C8_HELAN|nr:RING-H2 finger protein ATL51 [Helianthus annuus]KAF5794861.1 putative transcription factor C2H2 family [Helianthus annuus]KAJ0718761.1 putative transcription factor C2H2 family [Helianthus annuus]KAJ0721990.1 putative transcription factor C2H2 family [Helianthus annuus]